MPEHASILALIDQEIARLQEARTLFNGGDDTPGAKRRGRPAKAKGKKSPAKATRQLSEEARARIAAGQKKRWAAQKKAGAE